MVVASQLEDHMQHLSMITICCSFDPLPGSFYKGKRPREERPLIPRNGVLLVAEATKGAGTIRISCPCFVNSTDCVIFAHSSCADKGKGTGWHSRSLLIT